MKRPAFQWYPGDWRRDTALQACSIDARGLWIEMLNLMHDGDPYGHLTAGGVAITPVMLGTLTGLTLPRVKKLIAELADRKVFSRTADGVIYSRRMVRDEDLRERRASYGKLGGNPNLVSRSLDDSERPKDRDKVKPEVDRRVNTKVNPIPTPATATAVAVATAVEPVVVGQALAIRANEGLAEHPDRPQLIPRIIATSGSTLQAAEAIVAAGVPLDFAEDRVYELAKSHVAEDQVTSLNYFRDAVIRSWEQAKSSPPNGNGKHRTTRKREPVASPGDASYAAGRAAFEEP